jgi:serine/threonine protein kinase
VRGSIEEYKREIEVMKSLRVNVVQLVGVCDKEYYGSRVFCIVMELMEGGTLKEELDKNIDITRRVEYAMDVALALREMHKNNILHRDIKPENVFLSKDKNTAKLGDFGVSKIVKTDQQKTMVPIGTPLYMAPELLCKNAREATSPASDVYSFGLLLYEVITGRVPYNDYEKQYQIDAAKDKGILPEIPSYYPQEITVLIKKCCAWNSVERPSMDQVYDSLNSYHEKRVANVDVRCTMTP